jgi:hypothetical protein
MHDREGDVERCGVRVGRVQGVDYCRSVAEVVVAGGEGGVGVELEIDKGRCRELKLGEREHV